MPLAGFRVRIPGAALKGEKEMKINNLSPDKLNKFFEVVDTCEGKVELVTGEGDRLNLKSALCKYVAFANILVNADIPEIEVICYNPNDTLKLITFLVEG